MHFRSSIPKAARHRVISTHESNGKKHEVECIFARKIVGIRRFDEAGRLYFECPLKDGVTHGTLFFFDFDSNKKGFVTSTEPYRNGLAHGTARQYSERDGSLIGTYSMKNGTGLDLWRIWNFERKSYSLSEVRYLNAGKWHGFEWWLTKIKNLSIKKTTSPKTCNTASSADGISTAS